MNCLNIKYNKSEDKYLKIPNRNCVNRQNTLNIKEKKLLKKRGHFELKDGKFEIIEDKDIITTT